MSFSLVDLVLCQADQTSTQLSLKCQTSMLLDHSTHLRAHQSTDPMQEQQLEQLEQTNNKRPCDRLFLRSVECWCLDDASNDVESLSLAMIFYIIVIIGRECSCLSSTSMMCWHETLIGINAHRITSTIWWWNCSNITHWFAADDYHLLTSLVVLTSQLSGRSEYWLWSWHDRPGSDQLALWHCAVSPWLRLLIESQARPCYKRRSSEHSERGLSYWSVLPLYYV